jgi:hypothetical protein
MDLSGHRVDARPTPDLGSAQLGRLRVWALAALLLAALFASVSPAHAAPAPVAGKSVVLAGAGGTVRIRLPGTAGYVPLHGARSVPLRTIVDTLHGVVRLTSANGKGNFYAGAFQIFEQGRLTDLHLFGGNFKACKRKLAGAGAAAKPVRRLWGNAQGRFRTRGRYAAATVRGTFWLTADYCTNSAVTVRRGTVAVLDLVRKTTVIVGSGHSYVAAPSAAPLNTSPPTITGTPTAGQTLTGKPGTWTGTPKPTFAYQWQRCDAGGASCVAIVGATGVTYVVQAADAGSTLRLRVTAKNAAGSASATSAATGAVGSAPVNTGSPTISGTASVGSALAAQPGTWTGVPAPTFAYQWQRCDFQGNGCAAIAGATAQSYTVQAGDVNSTIRVQVSATNAAGSASAVSAAVGPIKLEIAINDVTANEGNLLPSGGTSITSFVFTVTLSSPSAQTVTVNYLSADGTADAKDYGTVRGTLTFSPGQTSKTITVSVVGDNAVEPNETFFVNLSAAVNATIADGQGVGTIVNDDAVIP